MTDERKAEILAALLADPSIYANAGIRNGMSEDEVIERASRFVPESAPVSLADAGIPPIV